MSKSNSDELDRILWELTDQSAWDLSGITQKQSDDLSETLSADRIEAKELIEAEYSKREQEARVDGAIMGAKFGNAAFRQQSIAEPGKAINLDKVRDSGIKQAVAWARENL